MSTTTVPALRALTPALAPVMLAALGAAAPGALLQRVAVRDAAGNVLPYQVTNVAPEAKDPGNQGIAYGENSAVFMVETTGTVARH